MSRKVANIYDTLRAQEQTHWHGTAKMPFPINDHRCSVCNADGHLGPKPLTPTAQPRKGEEE